MSSNPRLSIQTPTTDAFPPPPPCPAYHDQLEVKIEGLPLKRAARKAKVIHAPFNEVGTGACFGSGWLSSGP